MIRSWYLLHTTDNITQLSLEALQLIMCLQLLSFIVWSLNINLYNPAKTDWNTKINISINSDYALKYPLFSNFKLIIAFLVELIMEFCF